MLEIVVGAVKLRIVLSPGVRTSVTVAVCGEVRETWGLNWTARSASGTASPVMSTSTSVRILGSNCPKLVFSPDGMNPRRLTMTMMLLLLFGSRKA